VVKELGVDNQAATKKLSRWADEGWLRRARRGLYIPVPLDAHNPETWAEDPLLVAEAVWSPCYFTGWTAANHWALTEQTFRTVVLKTSGRVRKSSVQLLDHEYLIAHIPPKTMAWGMKTEWRAEIRLKFADPARTVIDILDDPRLGGGIRHAAEILAAFLQDHDTNALIEDGDRLGNRAVFKRLGYLSEILRPEKSDLISACRERVSAGISVLDPSGPTSGRRVTKWGLLINTRVRPENPA
jgi:predicted transcriptional regulator of viral defense system